MFRTFRSFIAWCFGIDELVISDDILKTMRSKDRKVLRRAIRCINRELRQDWNVNQLRDGECAVCEIPYEAFSVGSELEKLLRESGWRTVHFFSPALLASDSSSTGLALFLNH